jgi:hypothetical protein
LYMHFYLSFVLLLNKWTHVKREWVSSQKMLQGHFNLYINSLAFNTAWAVKMLKSIFSRALRTNWLFIRVIRQTHLIVLFNQFAQLASNRPFPFWVKFWSRQVWTKISSQLERASQN